MQTNFSETVERKFIESYDIDEWEIETDKGWVGVSQIHKTIEYDEWLVKTISGLSITCADTHIVFDANLNEVFVKDLVPYESLITTKNGPELVITCKPLHTSSNMYDITVDSEDHRFWSDGILSHNTTTTAGFLLWSVLFQEDYSVAILANKGSLAREILSRIKYAYEFLPKFLQQGIVTWNMGNIVLENGSKIFAYATSASGIRGGSFNCVTGDTKITVKDCNELTHIIDIQEVDESHYKVLTHQGFKSFDGVKAECNNDTKVKLTFNNNQILKCTTDHLLKTSHGNFITAKECQVGDELFNDILITSKELYESSEDVYDLINVEDTHSYITNSVESHNCVFMDEMAFIQHSIVEDFFRSTYPVISSGKTTKVIIVSTPNGLNMFYKMWMDAIEKRSLYVPYEIHWSQVPGRDEKWKEETIRNTSAEAFEVEFNCEFVGSTATLIAGSKLRAMAFRNPVLSEDNFDMYIQPQEGHHYVCTVDCSEGIMQDYSTINVIDVTSMPYVQVAKYRDNTMPLLFLPNTIYSVAMKYNEAFVLVETNNIGQQVIDILHYELEYENIYKVDQHHIKGQTISSGYKRNSSIGIRTTKTVKKIGCANLKTMVEGDKLIIYDFDTILELNSFVRTRDTYAAEDGAHDDLVMGLVLFAWLSSQTYFKDSTNTDIRKLLLEEQNILIEETMTPVGFIDNGLSEDHFVNGDDIWYFNLPNV